MTALRESQVDERAFHDEAISSLQAEYRRLQSRIDAMYLDFSPRNRALTIA